MLDRATVEEVLGIGRSRFFGLLKEYRHDPDRFSIAYQRESLTIDRVKGFGYQPCGIHYCLILKVLGR